MNNRTEGMSDMMYHYYCAYRAPRLYLSKKDGRWGYYAEGGKRFIHLEYDETEESQELAREVIRRFMVPFGSGG